MDPISSISAINASPAAFRLAAADAAQPAAAAATAGGGFFDGLIGGLQRVDDLQHAAIAAQDAFAQGKDIPVHQVMAASEKASLSMEMVVAIRNRALEAYQDIMRMQV